MAEGPEPFGGWAEVLQKVSSPVDIGLLFIIGPLAYLLWFFLAPAALLALPPATFAVLVSVFVLGLKKLTIDAAQEAKSLIQKSGRHRLVGLEKILQFDRIEHGGRAWMFDVLIEEKHDFDKLIDEGLVPDNATINVFVDELLKKRQKVLNVLRPSKRRQELH